MDELRRDMRRFAENLDELKETHAAAARIAEKEAERRAPRGATGRLRASIRSSGQAKTGVIRAGRGTAVDYAVYVHYGTKHTKPNRFVDEAVEAKQSQIVAEYDKGIEQLIRRYDLD